MPFQNNQQCDLLYRQLEFTRSTGALPAVRTRSWPQRAAVSCWEIDSETVAWSSPRETAAVSPCACCTGNSRGSSSCPQSSAPSRPANITWSGPTRRRFGSGARRLYQRGRAVFGARLASRKPTRIVRPRLVPRDSRRFSPTTLPQKYAKSI